MFVVPIVHAGSGAKTGEPRMGPPSFMERIGLAATDEQARVAAEYFSSIDFKPWIRVVETDMVPETRFAGWIHKVIEGGGMEPIGTRVVESVRRVVLHFASAHPWQDLWRKASIAAGASPA